MTYQPKAYREQGGDRIVIASGGELDIESGGALKSAGTDISALLAQLGGIDRVVKVEKVALAAVDTAGGLFAWQNPLATRILVLQVIGDVTTPASGACTADVGVAGDGTTSDNSLIDGADVGSAAIVTASTPVTPIALDENGGTTDWITGSVATGASAGIVGNAYIRYFAI